MPRRGERKGQKRPERIALPLPTLSGHLQLQDLVQQYGGRDLVATDLAIAPELLEVYMSGQLEPPYALLVAIYWHTPYGFRMAFSASHWTHLDNWHKRQAAEARCARFRALLGALAGRLPGMGDELMLLADAHGLDDAWGDGGDTPMSTQLGPLGPRVLETDRLRSDGCLSAPPERVEARVPALARWPGGEGRAGDQLQAPLAERPAVPGTQRGARRRPAARSAA